MRSSSWIFAVLVCLAHGALAQPAREVRSIEYGDWPTTVFRLRDNSDGSCTVHLVVRDEHGELAECAGYLLKLDEAGAQAFSLAACDASTRSSELTLVDRHFLYSHAGDIALPIIPAVTVAPPPPVPPPPPPPETTCWALIGPLLADPETGERKTVDPTRLMVSFAPATPSGVQQIAFDRGWLLRAPMKLGLSEVAYALVPWHNGRRSGLVPEVPAGVVHTRLQLRCHGDPLGPLSDGPIEVPRRLEVTTPDGKRVTLHRRQSDGELAVQSVFGMVFAVIGGVGLFYAGLPMVIVGARGGHDHLLPIGLGVLGGSGALIAAGWAMATMGKARSDVRQATRTVGARPKVTAGLSGLKLDF